MELPAPIQSIVSGDIDITTGLGLLVAAVAAKTVAKLVLEGVVFPVLFKGADQNDSLQRSRFTLGKKLGSGSYGAVYEATAVDGTDVVIKETNMNVYSNRDGNTNARDFALAELYMNLKLKTCGQSSRIAQFVGHYNSIGADPYFSLVFQKEGTVTLMDALKERSFPSAGLTRSLGVADGDDETVVRKITGQIFRALAGIHGWSVVHRDIKGENLILSLKDKRFKLIDFGVACDLATKTNYRSDLQPFDPSYCPPEAPPENKGGAGGIVISAGGKFDVFSAGLLLAQMAFPSLRSDQGIKGFKKAIADYEYDLDAWRETKEGSSGFAAGFELLDANDGWTLLKGCLREAPGSRISSSAAASSKFCLN